MLHCYSILNLIDKVKQKFLTFNFKNFHFPSREMGRWEEVKICSVQISQNNYVLKIK